eukprot:gene24096-22423_t
MLFASITKGFFCLAVVMGLANTAHAQQAYCDNIFGQGKTKAVEGFTDINNDDGILYGFDTMANCKASLTGYNVNSLDYDCYEDNYDNWNPNLFVFWGDWEGFFDLADCVVCDGGNKNGGDSHHDSVKVLKYTKTSLDAYESCKTECTDDTDCTAFEVHQVGKRNKKNKKNKKRNNYYKCELHTAGINAATRRSKSCKMASCTLKEETPQ